MQLCYGGLTARFKKVGLVLEDYKMSHLNEEAVEAVYPGAVERALPDVTSRLITS